jgi:hypothetical protein
MGREIVIDWVSTVQGKVRETFAQGVIDSPFIDRSVKDCEAGWGAKIVAVCSTDRPLLDSHVQDSYRERTLQGTTAKVAG